MGEYQSFGFGVNSVALAEVLHYKPECIFADTGNEMPETYEYIKTYPHPVTILNTPVQGYDTLQEFCLGQGIPPMRHFRWCTDKFKKQRINKYIKAIEGKNEVTQYIGIAYDERHRATITKKGRFNYRYPLVEQKIDRNQCIEIIKNAGLTVPPKSGCWFCPFQTKKKWIKLLREHPDLYDEAVVLDEVGDKIHVYDKGLRELRGRVNLGLEQKTLFEKDDDEDWECQFCMII